MKIELTFQQWGDLKDLIDSISEVERHSTMGSVVLADQKTEIEISHGNVTIVLQD